MLMGLSAGSNHPTHAWFQGERNTMEYSNQFTFYVFRTHQRSQHTMLMNLLRLPSLNATYICLIHTLPHVGLTT